MNQESHYIVIHDLKLVIEVKPSSNTPTYPKKLITKIFKETQKISKETFNKNTLDISIKDFTTMVNISQLCNELKYYHDFFDLMLENALEERGINYNSYSGEDYPLSLVKNKKYTLWSLKNKGDVK